MTSLGALTMEHVNNTKLVITANETSLYVDREIYEILISGIVLMLILLVAFLGNASVIYVIITTSTLQDQNSNIFIINLAVSDILSSIVVMLSAFVALVLDARVVTPIWCDIVCAVNYCLIIVSMLTLTFISIDRYIAVLHTFKYDNIMRRERIFYMIVYTWFQGVAFALPPVTLGWVHYDYWEVVCAIDWQYQKTKAIYYVVVAFIVCFAVPGLNMLHCYIRIIHETGKPRTMDNRQNQDIRRREKKTIRSLLVVVLLFFVCLTPFCVTKLLKVIFSDPHFVPKYANLSASYFGYMSSVVNPFVYAIFRSDFRNAYCRLARKINLQYYGSTQNCTETNNNNSSQKSKRSLSISRIKPISSSINATPCVEHHTNKSDMVLRDVSRD